MEIFDYFWVDFKTTLQPTEAALIIQLVQCGEYLKLITGIVKCVCDPLLHLVSMAEALTTVMMLKLPQ